MNRQLLPSGLERDVGVLGLEGVERPEETWPTNESAYFFLSHTGRDGVKEELALPTKYFLEQVLGVEKAFLDQQDSILGERITKAIVKPAYKCTHALVLISPRFREQKWCVRELNTFLERKRREDIEVLLVLWKVENLDGFHPDTDKLVWLRAETHCSPNFMVQFLWPELIRKMGLRKMRSAALERHLVRQIESARGHGIIPPDHETFVKNYRNRARWIATLLIGSMVAILIALVSGSCPFPIALQRNHESPADKRLRAVLHPLSMGYDNYTIETSNKNFLNGTRQWVLDYFDEWLSDNHRPRVLVLFADPGVGKTAIMSRLVQERPTVVAAYYFCQYGHSQRDGAKRMMLSLIYRLCQKFPDYKDEISDIDFANIMGPDWNIDAIFTELMLTPLTHLTEPDERYVIFIDALDELASDSSKSELVACIRKHFHGLPSWINVLVSARPEAQLRGLRKFDVLPIERGSKNNQADLRHYLLNALNIHFPNEMLSSDREAAVGKIVSKCSGLFLYAKFAAESLASVEDPLTDPMAENLPAGLGDFYETSMKRLVVNPTESLAWNVLEMVLVAREPLHVELVQDLVGCSDYERKAVLDTLSSFLPVADRKIHVYHRSFAEWLAEDGREDDLYQIRTQSSEKKIARRCIEMLGGFDLEEVLLRTKKGEDGQPDQKLNYLLKYTLQHVASSKSDELFDKARALAIDIHFILARAKVMNAMGHANDCSALNEWKPDRVVELLGRSVRLSVSIVSTDERQLPGQLIGRLLGATSSLSETSLVREEVKSLIDQWKSIDYGFKWWCPITPSWEQANDACLMRIEEYSDRVGGIVWSPDGQRIATSGYNRDGTATSGPHRDETEHSVRIWDAASGEYLTEFARPPPSKDYDTDAKVVHYGLGSGDLFDFKLWLYAVAWSPDGKRLAAGLEDGRVGIWDTGSGGCLEVLSTSEKSKLVSIVWPQGGLRILSSMKNRTTQIWDVRPDHRLEIDSRCFKPVFSPDGRWIACSIDYVVRILDTSTGEFRDIRVGNATHHFSAPPYLSFSPDGSHIATLLRRKLRVWNITTNETVQEYVRDLNTSVEAYAHTDNVIWSPDGHSIALFLNGKVRIVAAVSGECLTELSSNPCRFAWAPGGSQIATASFPKQEDLRSTSTDYYTIDIDLDDNACSKSVQIWDTSLKNYGASHALQTLFSPVWSPDGTAIATVDLSKTGGLVISVLNATTGDPVTALTTAASTRSESLSCLKWSPDGAHLATTSSAKKVQIWHFSTSTSIGLMTNRKMPSDGRNVEWSPDGRLLASFGGRQELVGIWNTTGDHWISVRGRHSIVTSVAWTPDGNRIAAGYRSILVWNVRNNKCEQTLTGDSVVYSADNDWDLFLFQNQMRPGQMMRVFDISKKECVTVLTGHSDDVLSLAWSPDGHLIASASTDGTVRIWSTSSSECVDILWGNEAFQEVAWSRDGTKVAARDQKSFVHVWDIKSGREAHAASPYSPFPPLGFDLLEGGENSETVAELHTKEQRRSGRMVFAKSPEGQISFFELMSTAENRSQRIKQT